MSIYSTHSYYVYQYLRADGTPYYIGKGKGNRAWSKQRNEIKKPSDIGRIEIVKNYMTESDAHTLEKQLIASYGRKDLGTGILRNKTDGGEGNSGYIYTDADREKMSRNRKGKSAPNGPKKHTDETKRKISMAVSGENNPNYGKKHDSKALSIMSEKKQGENNPMYGYKFDPVVCPHCGKSGGGGSMKRWHYDNCKQKGA